MSGCSDSARRDCTHICFRKYRNVCERVDVIEANESPYDMAKVVERNSGEYASYFATSRLASGEMILVTS